MKEGDTLYFINHLNSTCPLDYYITSGIYKGRYLKYILVDDWSLEEEWVYSDYNYTRNYLIELIEQYIKIAENKIKRLENNKNY